MNKLLTYWESMLGDFKSWLQKREADVRARAHAIFRHPSLLVNFYRNELNWTTRHIAVDGCVARELWLEMSTKDIDTIITTFRSKLCFNTATLYALCRWFKPEVIVETGVGIGASSAFILAALKENGSGHLYSIDLPNVTYDVGSQYTLGKEKAHSDILPKQSTSGFGVPMELRGRWTLMLGDSKEVLPSLIKKLGQINFFHHDSLHTYEHMMFEYETAWSSIKSAGVIASDDVDWNAAFSDFCSTKKIVAHIIRGTGFAVKT